MILTPTINTELSVFCKQKLPYVENYPDLENDLLPFIKLDYLTIHCHSLVARHELQLELKKLKPDFHFLNLDEINEKSPQDEIDFKNDFFSKTSENKYKEKKYDVIFYSHNNEKKRISKHYVRIPGSFSDVFLREIFNKKMIFPDYNFSLTRFDFKIVLPTFKYKAFDYDLCQFFEFHQLQNLRDLKFDHNKKFAIGYINKRTTRRMVRIYITGQKQSLTFELECKKDSAKRYSEAVFNKDWYEFNKILILEFIEMFKVITQSSFTQPLLDWNEHYVKVLREKEFPTESYYKRNENKAEVQFIKNQNQTRTALSKTIYTVNLNLTNFTKNLDSKSSFHLLIYSFCSKLLLTKWNSVIGGPHEIRALVHKSHWDNYFIKTEGFTTTGLYEIEFHLKDLLTFLNLSNQTQNRTKVIEVLKEICDQRVEFCVNKNTFYQPFFYSLNVTHTTRGTPVGIKITIHPLIVYDLLNYAVYFEKNFLEKFYKLLDEHRFTEKKKGFSFGYLAFVSVLLSYKQQNDDRLKVLFATRHKKKPELRERQVKFFNDVIHLANQCLKVNLGINTDGVIQCPVNYQILHNILNKTTDKVLNNTNFIFLPVKKELIETENS